MFAEHDPIVYLSYEAAVHNRIFTPWIKPEDVRTVPLILPGSSKVQILEQGRRMAGMILNDLKAKGIAKEKIGIEEMVPAIRGGLEEAGENFLNKVSSTVKEWAFREATEDLKIVYSQLRENAVALGAASLVMQKTFAHLW